MTTLQEILNYCNELLNPSSFSDYCTNGLQVQGKSQVRHLAAAVTANSATIEQAIAVRADCLLVHHGLFWQKDSYDIVGNVHAKLRELLINDISLIAYHLPLDAHRTFGNNWLAAKELGWTNLEPFPAGDKQPIGVKGSFAPIHRSFLAEHLASFYNNLVDAVWGGNEIVKSGALISGGAHKMLSKAALEGVDCYITGTRDFPVWDQAHEYKVNFCAVGHSASEVIGPRALGEHLAAHFGLTYTFLSEENPF